MFADERKSKIIDMIHQNHSVTTSELTEIFQVSLETIRRDLESMEKQGLLKRVHGGAVSVKELQSYSNLTIRSNSHQAEKRKLAFMACSYIKEKDYIALDTGSTAIELAKAICERFQNLTILTNSLEVFHILSERKEYQIILAGGYYLSEEKSFYGHLTLDMIRQLHVKKSFITPSGVSLDFGISDHVQELIDIQRAMLEIADEVYILADSSKFESYAPLKICDLDTSYRYLTDTSLPENIFETYQKASISIKK